MDTVYKPQNVEEKWYQIWMGKKAFSPRFDTKNGAFSIVIPPPNITGSLHMGHALNNTIQDILIRWKRMKGYSVCWFPGTDHAGIATQVVVEKELKKEGKTRYQLGREKFIERVWEWKKQYGGIIEGQLKKLGVSCDWDRNSFTMDEKRSKAVQEAFVRLYKKGLIYRGHRMVNWCVRCLTALSDLEVEHQAEVGTLYYLKYPLPHPVPYGKKKFDFSNSEQVNELTSVPGFDQSLNQHLFDSEGNMTAVVIATTRPETILADMAVAVHPKDPRYKHLIGQEAILPIIGRKLKIIADEWADPMVGTGAVKITPAHDPNDFEVGERHGLKPIVVIGLNGNMTTNQILEEEGRLEEKKAQLEARAEGKEIPPFKEKRNYDKYDGIDRFKCREEIVKDLKEKGYWVKEEPWGTSPGRCARCGTIIEPYLSIQWFMKMKELAAPAVEVVKQGKVRFHPERFSKLYLDWMENIKDWCISRQLWWGHRIPAWYCRNMNCHRGKKSQIQRFGGLIQGDLKDPYQISPDADPIVQKDKPEKCPDCGGTDLTQDQDVLDTWFSSALWPLSTMGWPEETNDLRDFYPTQVLSTGRDIINLWVARMIMMGLEFKGKIPFSDVYIHATILDREGKRMSKSKGTGVDPLDLIQKYGADATRFGMILMSQGQDVRFSEERIQQARNFANKVWNASRFVRTNLSDDFLSQIQPKIENSTLKFYDHWILFKLFDAAARIEKQLEQFDFPAAAFQLYDFFWDDFCDWYVELSKLGFQTQKEMAGTAAGESRLTAVRGILYFVLSSALKLLHPFMPFLTEEIWENFNPSGLMIHETWPALQIKDILQNFNASRNNFSSSISQMELFMETVKGVRNMRAESGISAKQETPIIIRASDLQIFEKMRQELKAFTQASELKIQPESEKIPQKAFSCQIPGASVYLLLEGVVDLNAELSRLKEEYDQSCRELNQVRNRLMNPEFSEKAKKEIVQAAQEKEKQLSEKMSRTRERIESLTQ
jgi:valyl-tRNA synthetase